MKKTRFAFAALIVLAMTPLAFADPAEDLFAVGAKHYEEGRWQLAADEFVTFLGRYPNHASAEKVQFYLGESHVQMEQYEAAHKQFKDLQQGLRNRTFIRKVDFRIGETAYLMGDFKTALPALDHFSRHYPDDELMRYALPYMGEMALDANDIKLAKASYSQSLKQFPSGPMHDECRFGLGRAFEASGEVEQAIRFYSFLAEFPSKPLADDALLRVGVLSYKRSEHAVAAKSFQKIIDEFPDSELRPHALYWLGMSHVLLKQHQEAATVLAEAAMVTKEPELRPAVLFYLAESLRKTDRPTAAITSYDEVVAKWAKTEYADDALQARIQIAFDTGDYATVDELAGQFGDKYVSSPLLPVAMQLAARSAMAQENYDEAGEVFGYLTDPESAPKHVTAEFTKANLYYLALCRLGTKKYDQCIAALKQLEIMRGLGEPLTDGVYVAHGSALVGLTQYSEAIGYLKKYLAKHPAGSDSAQAQAQLVVALAETGQYAEMQKQYSILRDQFTGTRFVDPTTLHIAELLFKQRKYDEATKLFQYLADKAKSEEYQKKGLSGLAWTQLRQDNREEAAVNFNLLLTRFPDSELSAEAELVIAQTREQASDYEGAWKAYSSVIEQYPNSRQHAEAIFSGARVKELLEDRETAVTLLQRLAAKYPKFEFIDASLYQQAWLLTELEKTNEANDVFQRLHSDHPNSNYWADATYRLAESAHKSDQPARAKQLLDTLIKTKADKEVMCYALYLRGQLASEEQNWGEVADYMGRVLEDYADTPLRLTAEYWVAEATYRMGNYAEAGPLFDTLDKKTSDVLDSWAAMVPLRRSQTLAYRKQWEAAAEMAVSVKQRYPKFGRLYEADYVIGRALTSQARFNDAREALTSVLESPRGSRTETAAMAQWMIGETYFHQKNYEEALRSYHRVESLYQYPRWQALSLLQAGKCRELLNQPEEAARLYSQVVREYGETNSSVDAAARLQQVKGRPAKKPATVSQARQGMGIGRRKPIITEPIFTEPIQFGNGEIARRIVDKLTEPAKSDSNKVR